MRIYYCSKCNAKKEVHTKEDMVCSCGHIFGTSSNISTYINMRNSPISNTSQIELSEQSMDDNIAEMRASNRSKW